MKWDIKTVPIKEVYTVLQYIPVQYYGIKEVVIFSSKSLILRKPEEKLWSSK